MGSTPWTDRVQSRILTAQRVEPHRTITIKRGRLTVAAALENVEVGSNGTRRLIFAGEHIITLDRRTRLDGVSAPDWKP